MLRFLLDAYKISHMMKFAPVHTGRRVDVIAGTVRKVILKGTIAPGDRLPSEREMAEQFRVGRFVVREALRALETMGLVEIRRGIKGGCFVRDFNMRQISHSMRNILSISRVSLNDILEARLVFEGEILRLAIRRATETDLKRIEQNVKETKVLGADGAGIELKEKVHEFHLLLAQASKNPLYLLMMYSILDVIDEYMRALRYTSVVSLKTIEEHDEIFRCLKPRNRAKALTALCSHITKDNQRLMRRAARLNLAKISYLPIM
jgi:GntR family transcriptional repressor for pyruvate dehydrogenase complex